MTIVKSDSGEIDRENRFIEIGRLTKPVGLKGEAKLFPLTRSPEDLKKYHYLTIFNGDQTIQLYIERLRVKGRLAIVKFAEVDTIDAVEEFTGKAVFIERKQLIQPDKGEYFIRDLLGMEVININGEVLGSLTDILELPPHDVYVIDNGTNELLIPVIREFVQKIDMKNKCIVVKYDTEVND